MNVTFSKVSKHIIFWIVYLLLWSVHDLNYNINILENLKTNAIPFLSYAILLYINLYFLIPIFLLKKRIASYILLLIVAIVVITLTTSYYLSLYFENIDISTSDFFESIRGKIAVFTEVIISICLSMVLFLIDEWYKKDQLIKDLEQRQLASELDLTNNQINTHVLFNSLNSIYVMLDKKVNIENGQSHIFIKSDGMVIKVFIDDITYIETANDYIYINTTNKDRYLTLVSLKNIERVLPKEKFMRVHRYYLVGINHVNKLEGNLIHIGKTKIKISRTLRTQVYKSIIGTKLIER
ncbi:LytTR family transcriptional regulator DNA-binding domain-containing protein [Aquimarina pacifica]|uniref:LytTR family transcriptional regulator DNA-binding domain-containing protein n=1 Tax=Aquimarina pacifica TaxID=1296415 RepID=UPI000472BFB3|nr:LytTR family transcriptional regulator DNA-binding domain-containing protein [Aquimarina pacifica]